MSLLLDSISSDVASCWIISSDIKHVSRVYNYRLYVVFHVLTQPTYFSRIIFLSLPRKVGATYISAAMNENFGSYDQELR